MLTWLDEFTLLTGSAIIKKAQLPSVGNDVFRAVETLAWGMVRSLEENKEATSVRALQRFEADLLPFFSLGCANICQCYQLTRGFSQWLRNGSPTKQDAEVICRFFEDIDYVYFDCPQGTLELGGGVEIKAVFLRTGTVIDHRDLKNVPHPGHMRLEAIIGRSGVFSLSRIGCNVNDIGIEVADDARFPGNEIADLVSASGLGLPAIVQVAQETAFSALSFATKHKESSFLSTLPKIQLSRRTSHSAKAMQKRTMFDVTRIDLPFNPSDADRNKTKRH